MQNKTKSLMMLVTVLLVVGIGIGVYSWLKLRPLTAKLNIEAVPSGLTIDIDGRTANNGVNRVRPGTYNITASMNGFASDSQTITIKDGDNKFVGFVLNPNTSATANWYSDHPQDQQKSQDISSKISDSQAQQTLSTNPIIKILPFIDDKTGFRVDYGKSVLHPSDLSAIAIYITTSGQPAAKAAALGWLRFNGYDPAKLEIIYKTY